MTLLKRFLIWRKRKIARWESLCKQCGICCYEKESRLLYMEIDLSRPCEYLDLETMKCRVYKTMFSCNKWCGKVTLFHACFSRALPDTCGYVEEYRKFRIVPTAKFSSPE